MTTVLIVDDSIIIRNQLQSFFIEHLKYEVIGLAKDGEEAVEMYKAHKPDLVTLDLTMPNKDGMATLQDLREIDENAKVVIVSAVKNKDNIVKALAAGASGYFEKPLLMKSETYVKNLIDEITDLIET